MINENVLILLQARMSSTRLPGKVLLPFGSTTIIGYLLNELIKVGFSNKQICVATSTNESNKVLITYLQSKGIKYFAGSELNVLSRYQEASRKFDKDIIVRLTSDNPLINMKLIKCCINSHVQSKLKATSTRDIGLDRKITRFLPKGSSVDIFQKNALLTINEQQCDEFEKEHVIPAFFKHHKVNLINKTVLKKFGVDFKDIISVSIDSKLDYDKALLKLKKLK